MESARRYPDAEFLESTVEKMGKSRAVHGAILRVESGDGSLSWQGATGNLESGQRYFIASDGVDRTGQITIRHLISNTSGITDYFFGKDADGTKAASGRSSRGSNRDNPEKCTTPTRTTNSSVESSRR